MALDWRKETDYEFARHLQPQGWAWQFITRRNGYRAAWREVQGAEAAQKAYPGDPACFSRYAKALEASLSFGLVGFVDPDQRTPTFLLWLPAAGVTRTPPWVKTAGDDPWPGYP